jgi:hypothetical protein
MSASNSATTKPSRTLMLPIFFLFIGIFLRVYGINRALGGHDENAMLLYFGYSYPEYIISNYFDANNHIFHTLLVNLMAGWFGEDNALAIRLPTLIFGVAGLWVIYLTALELFHSQKTASIALLIASINPVHIHYSQTARGYSLIIFFSIIVIFFSLKLLRDKKERKHFIPLAICSFLSIYTLPTNIIFLFGLFFWFAIVLFVPLLRGEQGIPIEKKRRKVIWLFNTGVLIAIASLLAYSPVLEEMIDTARTHHLLTIDKQTGTVTSLIISIPERIFQGPLLWFLPFLVIGLFFGQKINSSRVLLFLIIYFIPLLITLISGIGGYPRNYLFNLPLFVLFLAAGFVKTGEWLDKQTRSYVKKHHIVWGITTFYTVITLGILLIDYYPSIRTPNPIPFQTNVKKFSGSNDLIYINDPKFYIYARNTLKNNLLQIIQENKLDGFKFIAPKSSNIENQELLTSKGFIPLLKGFLNQKKLASMQLDAKSKMIHITETESIAAFPADFEEVSQWKTIRGNGEVVKSDDHVLFGKQSLEIRASSQQSFIASASVDGEFTIDKPSLAVLIWGRKNFNQKKIAYHPILIGQMEFSGVNKSLQILTGKINDGISILIKEKPGKHEAYYWFINSSIGVLLPGRYKFNIVIKSDAGQRTLYDGFRLFFIELDV